jgi:hypothetical protein
VCSCACASSRVLRAAATRASCSRCTVAARAGATTTTSSSFLLAAAAAAVAACCPSMVERLEWLPDIVDKSVVVRGGGGRRRALGLD